MTKSEMEAQLEEAKAALLTLHADSNRYRWLKKFAHGANFDELCEMDEQDWDTYIDKAMNRR